MPERVINPIGWGDDSDETFIDARPIITKDTGDEGPKGLSVQEFVSELPPEETLPLSSDQGSSEESGLPLVPVSELKDSLSEKPDQPVSVVKGVKPPTPGTNSPQSL